MRTKEGLLGWLSGFKVKPKQLFLVHGELESKEALAASIRERLGYDPVVVTGVSEFELKKTEIVSKEEIYEDAIDNEAVEATKREL